MKSVITLIFVSFLGGCGLPERSPQPEPQNGWKVISDPVGGCACPTARKFYLMNTGSVPSDIAFTQYKNDMDITGHDETPLNFTGVLPGYAGRKTLACSPENSVTRRCGINYLWKVDGVVYSGNSVWNLAPTKNLGFWARVKQFFLGKKAEVNKINASEEPRLKALLGAKTSPGTQDCVKLCTSPNGNANCLRTDFNSGGSSGSERDDPVTSVLDLIKKAGDPGHVPVDMLISALGQIGNPCDRSGLSISKGVLSNSGAACYYTAAKGTAFELEFQIADTLSGRLSANDGKMSMIFPDPNAYGARIRFKDAGLDRDFGGEVWRADEISRVDAGSAAKFVVLTGPKRCIALKVK